MMAFSDFPPPEHFATFMHNTKVWEYFMMYAEKFDLLRHIQYNIEVLSVKKHQEFTKNGRYFLFSQPHLKNQELL